MVSPGTPSPDISMPKSCSSRRLAYAATSVASDAGYSNASRCMYSLYRATCPPNACGHRTSSVVSLSCIAAGPHCSVSGWMALYAGLSGSAVATGPSGYEKTQSSTGTTRWSTAQRPSGCRRPAGPHVCRSAKP